MFKKLCAFALTATTAFSLVACGGAGNSETSDGANKAGLLQKVVVNDFEKPIDFSPLRVNGIIRVNRERGEDAFGGDGCAQILLKKEDKTNVPPVMWQPFDLQFKANYTDWSYVTKLGFSIYNDQDEAVNINTELEFDGGSKMPQQYTLQPKQWTEIIYENYREYMPTTICKGIWFTFGGSAERDTVFYIDDITLYKTQKGYNKVTLELDEHEICSFDKIYQTKFIAPVTGGTTKASLNGVTSASAFSKDGGTSLKIEAPGGSADFATSSIWPGVMLYSPMVQMVNWEDYDANDKFCFDYYSPEENGIDYIWLCGYNSLSLWTIKFDQIKLQRGKWVTLTFTVEELVASRSGGESFEKIRESNFDDLSQIAIKWGEFVGPNRVMYLDNFRMEIVPNS